MGYLGKQRGTPASVSDCLHLWLSLCAGALCAGELQCEPVLKRELYSWCLSKQKLSTVQRNADEPLHPATAACVGDFRGFKVLLVFSSICSPAQNSAQWHHFLIISPSSVHVHGLRGLLPFFSENLKEEFMSATFKTRQNCQQQTQWGYSDFFFSISCLQLQLLCDLSCPFDQCQGPWQCTSGSLGPLCSEFVSYIKGISIKPDRHQREMDTRVTLWVEYCP